MGCAKSLLVGEHGSVARERGALAELTLEGEVVGAALRTRRGVKPVYVSPGHLVDLSSAVRLVLGMSPHYRVPEPIRLAHQATAALLARVDAEAPRPQVRDYPDFVRQR